MLNNLALKKQRPVHECKKCEFIWKSLLTDRLPVQCPLCKSKSWQQKRTNTMHYQTKADSKKMQEKKRGYAHEYRRASAGID